MSQCDIVLRDLKAGQRLTAREALLQYGIARLAARVHELRKTHKIQSAMTGNNGKRWAAYWMRAEDR